MSAPAGSLAVSGTVEFSSTPLRLVTPPAPRPGRELEVLRLVSEGLSVRQIARELAYSERTIKKVVQDLTIRFSARNRTHLVCSAIRNGWI
jgi:DNA-binding NarL/FixJ family response regulator